MARTSIDGSLLGKISGISAAAGSITSTDSVVTALSKVINARVVSVSVQTNTGGGSTNSTSFQALFNGPTVTPQSSSNKFLVIFAGQLGINPAASQTAYFTLFKSVGGGGATNVGPANGFAEVSTSGTFATTPGCVIYLDSPATTSSVQYSMYGRVTSGSATATICATNQTCTITVIELGIGN